MTLVLIGVNHKTAPIEVRERIAISREDLPETTRALAAVPGVAECMIVSTCNRVEILSAVESPAIDVTSFLHRHFGLDPKIVAAFVSWVIYVVLLLVRRSAGLRGRRAAYLSGVVFAVMVVVWTANLFSHVHRYGAQ